MDELSHENDESGDAENNIKTNEFENTVIDADSTNRLFPQESNDGKSFGSYKIIAEIARGDMGIVYKAYDAKLQRIVALKVSTQENDERFLREATTMAKLAHPNIVCIYDIGKENNCAYQGTMYEQQKKSQLAIDDFTREILLNPSAFLYYSRAFIYKNQQNYEAALEDIAKAIEIDAKDDYPYYLRTQINRALGKLQLALDDITQAISLVKTKAAYFYDRGVIYYELKNYEAAIADFDRALSLEKHVSYYNHKGIVYDVIEEFDKAILSYTAAIKFDPDYIYVYYNRGLVYHKQGKYYKAIVDFSVAIKKAPDYFEAYNARAISYHSVQQNERALLDHNRAISYQPDNVQNYYNRGVTHESLGNYQEALSDYEKCVRKDLQYAHAYDRMARIYHIQESYKLALETWEKCLALETPYKERIKRKIKECQQRIKGTFLETTFDSVRESITSFYNEEGEWTGIYKVDFIEKTRIEWRKKNLVKIHVRYKYKPISKENNRSGFDQRFFVVKKTKQKRYFVIEMGGVASGSF